MEGYEVHIVNDGCVGYHEALTEKIPIDPYWDGCCQEWMDMRIVETFCDKVDIPKSVWLRPRSEELEKLRGLGMRCG